MAEITDKKKILIIDDNKDLNTVLADKLSVSGFETSSAFDGEEGLAKAFETHPDVILLDMLMPKMDGLTTLKKLRDDAWGKTCKVMILTLIEETDYMAKTMEFNVIGYIVKTNQSLDEIVREIEMTIKNS